MVSRRRLFGFLTVLIFISLFVVACERPLGGTDDGADEANQATQTDVNDVNVDGGTDGDNGSEAVNAGSEATETDAASSTDEGDSETADSSEDAADSNDETQDDSSEAGGGAGDASDAADSADAEDDEEQVADSSDAAAEEDATAEDDAADESSDETAVTTIPATHTVAAGENLYRIGLKYGISWVAIAEENGLVNPNILTVGQVLKLPGASTPTPGPTPSPQTETTYIVLPGDNLFRIGLRFGISWVQIAEANGLVNPNLIKAGDELKIPVNAPGPAPQFSHVVKPGDTLFLISLQYGVAWPTIAEANNLSSPYVIYVGQTLEIPGSQ